MFNLQTVRYVHVYWYRFSSAPSISALCLIVLDAGLLLSINMQHQRSAECMNDSMLTKRTNMTLQSVTTMRTVVSVLLIVP
jgi:hypothetical protein